MFDCLTDATVLYLENLVLKLREELEDKSDVTDVAKDAVHVATPTNEPTWLTVMRKDKVYRQVPLILQL